MRRFLMLVLIFLIAAALNLVVGCKPKPEEPLPECQVDADCGLNKYCSGGKCFQMKTTPKQRAEAHIKKANELRTASKVDYQAVIAEYQAALNEVPGTPVEFNIGLCYMKMGEYERAEPVFKKARAQDPDAPNPVLALGRLNILKGRPDDALIAYEAYLRNHPGNLEVRTNVATLYRLQKKYDKAMAEIRKILVKDPAHPGAFNNLGLLYLAQGRILLAQMVTANGIQAQENVKKKPDACLYNNMGLIYLKMGYRDLAVANFRKAQKVDSRLFATNLNLGHMALKFNDFQTAKIHYELVLSENPNHREARLGLAQCMTGLRQPDEALAIYQQLIMEKPKDPVATFNVGVLYFDHLRKQKEAHAAFRKFLTFNYPDKKKKEQAEMYLIMEVEKPPEPQPPPEAAPAPEDEGVSAEAQPAAPEEPPAEEQPEGEGEAQQPTPEEPPAEEQPEGEGEVQQPTSEEPPAEEQPEGEGEVQPTPEEPPEDADQPTGQETGEEERVPSEEAQPTEEASQPTAPAE